MKKILLALLIFSGFLGEAQNSGIRPMADDLNGIPTDSAIKTLGRAMRILREFRIQAYVQVEWQRADSTSAYSLVRSAPMALVHTPVAPSPPLPTTGFWFAGAVSNFRLNIKTRKTLK